MNVRLTKSMSTTNNGDSLAFVKRHARGENAVNVLSTGHGFTRVANWSAWVDVCR